MEETFVVDDPLHVFLPLFARGEVIARDVLPHFNIGFEKAVPVVPKDRKRCVAFWTRLLTEINSSNRGKRVQKEPTEEYLSRMTEEKYPYYLR